MISMMLILLFRLEASLLVFCLGKQGALGLSLLKGDTVGSSSAGMLFWSLCSSWVSGVVSLFDVIIIIIIIIIIIVEIHRPRQR